ncbi:MAG: threonine--tRNA ligase [bacterium]
MDDKERLDALRHSASHIMAEAVRKLFPGVKLAIGPPIEDGFYYDFLTDKPFTPEDLEKIEKEMKKSVKKRSRFERFELPYEDARSLLEKNAETFKLELLEDLRGKTISFYRHDDFVDLCAGPHVEHTGMVKAFKLLKVAGAYWRGDEKNVMLQRIYGAAFPDKDQLDDYLARLREAEKRDHRRLGVELDLFSIHHQEAGPGLIYWHPRGAVVREIIEDFWKKLHRERGYQLLYTPHLVKADLWKTSGHYQMQYPMYFTRIDEDEYGVKPMNCPGHILIYKTRTRSYRDLPIRYAEMGTVYRHEKSGVLHGMLRVRGFTQDDAHVFCARGQLLDEMSAILDLTRFILSKFGFGYELRLSTRPEKSVGSDDNWDAATAALEKALEKTGLPYDLDPGEGVFYGPKIDFKLRDAIGRLWQGPTVQVDFNLPERFGMEYVAGDGGRRTPVMIHRAIFGSFERFMGILIEHYAGAFPLWVSPEQFVVLPISEKHLRYSREVCRRLLSEGFRGYADERSDTIGAKIRSAQLMKIPYMVVIGDREAAAGTLSVRCRKEGDLGSMTHESFAGLARERLERFD